MSLRLLSKGNNVSSVRLVEELLNTTHYRLMDPKQAPVIGIAHPKGLFVPFTASGWSHLFRWDTGLDVGDVVLLDCGTYRVTAYTPDYDVEVPTFGSAAITNDSDSTLLLIPYGGSLMKWKQYPFSEPDVRYRDVGNGVHASVFVYEASERELVEIDRRSVLSSLPSSLLVPPRSRVEFSENGILVRNEARISWTLRRKSLWDTRDPHVYQINQYRSLQSLYDLTDWSYKNVPPRSIDVSLGSDDSLQIGNGGLSVLIERCLLRAFSAFRARISHSTVWMLLDRDVRSRVSPRYPRVLAVDGVMNREAIMIAVTLADDLRWLEVF